MNILVIFRNLPTVTEFNDQIYKEKLKLSIKTTCMVGLSVLFMFKLKNISLLNRGFFIAGIIIFLKN